MTSAVKLPGAGRRPERPDPRVGLGVLVQLAVEPLDRQRQGDR
jgi:hypothetical protein